MRQSLRSFFVAGLLAGGALLMLSPQDAEARHRHRGHGHHHHGHRHHHHGGIGRVLNFGIRAFAGGGYWGGGRYLGGGGYYAGYQRPYAVYSQPYVTYSSPGVYVPSEPVLPAPAYEGAGLVLWNPATNPGPITFEVDGQSSTLEPGFQIRLTTKPSWTITFPRGNAAGAVSYSINDGKSYAFRFNEGQGWDLNETPR